MNRVSVVGKRGWYLKGDSTPAEAGASQSPTYPAHAIQRHNVSV